MTESIWVAMITHKYGTTTMAAVTYELVQLEVLKYVKEWWSEYIDGADIPSDTGDAIDTYFQHSGRDYVEFDECLLRRS
jgi:hypothetical protein